MEKENKEGSLSD